MSFRIFAEVKSSLLLFIKMELSVTLCSLNGGRLSLDVEGQAVLIPEGWIFCSSRSKTGIVKFADDDKGTMRKIAPSLEEFIRECNCGIYFLTVDFEDRGDFGNIEIGRLE